MYQILYYENDTFYFPISQYKAFAKHAHIFSHKTHWTKKPKSKQSQKALIFIFFSFTFFFLSLFFALLVGVLSFPSANALVLSLDSNLSCEFESFHCLWLWIVVCCYISTVLMPTLVNYSGKLSGLFFYKIFWFCFCFVGFDFFRIWSYGLVSLCWYIWSVLWWFWICNGFDSLVSWIKFNIFLFMD